MNAPSPEHTAPRARGLIWKMLGGTLLLILAAVISLFLPIWDIGAIAAPDFPASAARTPEQVRFRRALSDIFSAKNRGYASYRRVSHKTADEKDSQLLYETYQAVLPQIPGLLDLQKPGSSSADSEDPKASLDEEARICSKLLLLRVHAAPSLEEQIQWSVLHLTFAKHFAEAARDFHERDSSFDILNDALENLRFLQTTTADVVHTSPALREALLALPPLGELAIQGLEESYWRLDPCFEDADLADGKLVRNNPYIQEYHWIPYFYQPQRTRKIVLETIVHERAVLRGDIPETSQSPMQKHLSLFTSTGTGKIPIQVFFPGTWRNIVGTITIFNLEYMNRWRDAALNLQLTQDELLRQP